MNDRQKGIACIIASAFGFALMAFFVRLCDDFGESVSCFQKSLFRNLIALFIAAVVFAKGHLRRRAADEKRPSVARLPLKAWLLLLGRSASGIFGIFGNF